MPGDILDLIDNALSDWSASDDAMRWRPEGDGESLAERASAEVEQECERRSISFRDGPVYFDTLSDSLGAVDLAPMAVPQWTAIGPFETAGGLDEWTVFVTRGEMTLNQVRQMEGLEPLPGPYFAGPLEAEATFTSKIRPEAQAAICRMFHFDHPLPLRRISRCPLCNPNGNPPELPIDGREYARRRAARKRR